MRRLPILLAPAQHLDSRRRTSCSDLSLLGKSEAFNGELETGKPYFTHAEYGAQPRQLDLFPPRLLVTNSALPLSFNTSQSVSPLNTKTNW